ncbi:hypothetical protein B566_EDAN014433 [Ephemera danica]|nr:hypothetical protein B566_EDAN014433 [Ephemera danica]
MLSVNPIVARWIPDLFSLNERATYVGRWAHGFFSMTAVGATNVGSIKVYCDEDLKTNQRKWRYIRHKDQYLGPENKEGIHIRKGELFGEFKMGSTIVIIFEAPEKFDFRPELQQKIYVGEALSKCLI